MTAVQHIIPVNDIYEHEEADTCWCAPEIREERLPDGPPVRLVVHHALDLREAGEGMEPRPLS